MSAAAIAGLVCLALSWLYHGACAAGCLAWRRRASRDACGTLAHESPVSVMVPMRGVDRGQEELLRGLLHQDYPCFEVVVGALDPEDPAVALVERLRAEMPEGPLRVVAGGKAFAANRKVCNLDNMLAAASHDILVLCDSDMSVSSDYLRQVTAPFADSRIGLVTCVYRGCEIRSLAARLEALAIGTDFVPAAVLAAWPAGPRFALGATVALRRAVLDEIGGFRAIADYLADDYLLGWHAAKNGWKTVLSTYVVDDVLGRQTFGETWARRVRWARTMRAMQPLGWLGAAITHAVPISLVVGATVGGALGAALCAGTVFMRMAFACWYSRQGTSDRGVYENLWLLPVADLLNFTVWCASFTGRTVQWRGERFRIERGGRLRSF